jgi:glucokinase
VTALREDAPVLAVDVGGTTIKAELVAGERILARDQRPTPHGAAAVDTIADLGAGLLEATDGDPVARAGVVLPGLVDRHRGVGVFSANIGWRDVPAADRLREAWRIPVLVDHDVTAAGWAEWRLGAGRGVDDLVFVAVGTGISAAVVSGGRLVRGGPGQAGELGHIVVRPDGPPCGCGARGCLETIASATSIVREYEARVGRPVGSAAKILARVGDDPAAEAVVTDAVAALADGLAGAVQLLAPARLVVGGGLGEAGAAVLDPLRRALAERCRVVPAPELAAARFGARAGVVGAALLARVGPIDEAAPNDEAAPIDEAGPAAGAGPAGEAAP